MAPPGGARAAGHANGVTAAVADADDAAVAAEARAARRGMLAAKAWYLWTYSAQALL